MPTAETIPVATATDRETELSTRRGIAGAALAMTDRLVHAPSDLLRHAVTSVVVVDVDVNVDVAPRATRARNGAGPAPARG